MKLSYAAGEDLSFPRFFDAVTDIASMPGGAMAVTEPEDGVGRITLTDETADYWRGRLDELAQLIAAIPGVNSVTIERR